MKTSPTLRLLIMGVILMALNVPLTMMCGIVDERESRRNEVAAAVQGPGATRRRSAGQCCRSRTAGRGQIPTDASQSASATYHFLPEQLEIDGVVDPIRGSAPSSRSSSIRRA